MGGINQQIEALLINAAGVLISSQAQAQRVRHYSVQLAVASAFNHPQIDQRPDILESDLESARKEIRSIIRRIERLDGWALSVARRSEAQETFKQEALDAGGDVTAILAAFERTKIPPEEWHDKVAIKHLRALEKGLTRPIETLIQKSSGLPSGKGAKPNLQAREVALIAGRALVDLADKPISYWRDSTAYAKLTGDLFHLFKIKADTRRPCEWALSELRKET